MIPPRVIECLRGPSVMQLGTRDADLRPAHAHASAAHVDEQASTVTVFITTERAKRALGDLANNGRVAFTLSQASHESYQLKGTFLDSRPATEEDERYQAACRDTLWREVSKVFPEELMKPLFLGAAYKPSMAITFRVEEVYLQTPGPEAGKRIA
jgi:pyridoxamine 5'-phosphate oxidase-like protein